MDGQSITPARRLDSAPAELRTSSTRQTITARPSTSARSSTTPDTPDFEAFNPE